MAMLTQSQLKQFQELDIMNDGGLLPVSQKSKKKLYLCWRNSNGIECKMIGPQTKCFCNHRFKEHQYLDPKGKKPFCKAPKCKCKCFDYIPAYGAYDFKCLCKHSYKQHDCITKMCNRQKCKNCTGFKSSWTCSCGAKYADHITIIENYQQRKAKGKAVNDMVRLNQQLNVATQQGSLYKPLGSHNTIKQDPEVRLKQKRESLGIKVGTNKKQQIQYEEVEEYKLTKSKRKAL